MPKKRLFRSGLTGAWVFVVDHELEAVARSDNAALVLGCVDVFGGYHRRSQTGCVCGSDLSWVDLKSPVHPIDQLDTKRERRAWCHLWRVDIGALAECRSNGLKRAITGLGVKYIDTAFGPRHYCLYNQWCRWFLGLYDPVTKHK